jgi:hypothetical protein
MQSSVLLCSAVGLRKRLDQSPLTRMCCETEAAFSSDICIGSMLCDSPLCKPDVTCFSWLGFLPLPFAVLCYLWVGRGGGGGATTGARQTATPQVGHNIEWVFYIYCATIDRSPLGLRRFSTAFRCCPTVFQLLSHCFSAIFHCFRSEVVFLIFLKCLI